jgi:hypothetical protein
MAWDFISRMPVNILLKRRGDIEIQKMQDAGNLQIKHRRVFLAMIPSPI